MPPLVARKKASTPRPQPSTVTYLQLFLQGEKSNIQCKAEEQWE